MRGEFIALLGSGAASSSGQRKGVRAMADPKMLLAALAAIAAGLLIIGFISLDWRFFAASALASLVITAVGVKAGGWRALNPFR
jgi:hypothetical protein